MNNYIELSYAGGLQLDKVTLRIDAIESIQLPINDTFGAIIVTDSGDKLPVKEKYTEIIKQLTALKNNLSKI